MQPKIQIETGYMIGGRTWISDKWNEGTLTKDDIQSDMAENEADLDDEITREDLRKSEVEVAQDMVDDGNGTFEDCLARAVENEFRLIQDQQGNQREFVEALEDVYNNWCDDQDDTEHIDRIYRAHRTLDDYCRNIVCHD